MCPVVSTTAAVAHLTYACAAIVGSSNMAGSSKRASENFCCAWCVRASKSSTSWSTGWEMGTHKTPRRASTPTGSSSAAASAVAPACCSWLSLLDRKDAYCSHGLASQRFRNFQCLRLTGWLSSETERSITCNCHLKRSQSHKGTHKHVDTIFQGNVSCKSSRGKDG